jgi:hypothetical protein
MFGPGILCLLWLTLSVKFSVGKLKKSVAYIFTDAVTLFSSYFEVNFTHVSLYSSGE